MKINAILKRIITISSLFLTLSLTTSQISSAGIILMPAGVIPGAVIAVIGAWRHNGWLILLNGEGNQNDSILNALSKQYPEIDDYDALKDLSEMISKKILESKKDQKGQVEISISKEEIEEIFEASGLIETNSEVISKLIADLKF